MDSVRSFSTDNPSVTCRVDKVDVDVGINDIKFFNSHKFDVSQEFRCPLSKLIRIIQITYPFAQITFKCVIPFKLTLEYQAKSVHEFNILLLDLCEEYHCVFLDCFSKFLDNRGADYQQHLFKDRWHLNGRGLGLLCRIPKFIVYNNIFNAYVKAPNF